MKLGPHNTFTVYFAAFLTVAFWPKAMGADSGPIMNPSQPRAGVSGVLKDRPFHAMFEITGTQPSPDAPLWVAEMFRNRAGSLRTEMSDHRFGWILDARTKRFIGLDHISKIAVVSPVEIPDSPDSAPRWGFNKFPTFTEESATILGVTCKKVMLSNDKTQSSSAGEIWIAYDLGIVMQDNKPQPAGSTVWRAVSIDRSEPDASVFDIPQGYHVASQ
jgi:hypothetical protein